MGDNNFLTPEELKDVGRKIVELSSGKKILIRKIGRAQLAYFREGLPDVALLAGKDNDEIPAAADLERREKMMDLVMIAGVIEPQLYADPKDGPTPLDFEYADQLTIFKSIMQMVGHTTEAAEEILPLSETD